MSNKQFNKLPVKPVQTNATQGKFHRLHFYDLEEFHLSKVDLNSVFYEAEDSAETALIKGDFSFAYLREDKIRTIHAYDDSGALVSFDDFCNRMHIGIASKNLFKTSKYLSRICRLTRYGGFFRGLDVYINEDPGRSPKKTDGISLISLELAIALGWDNAEAEMSAQFTLFFGGGLVKGHCVISAKIKHDIVIFGHDNIKQEISLDAGLQYVALEPVGLSNTLRLDIQSLLNLFGLFGPEQYLTWTHRGIEAYKADLFAGNITRWLDDFDDIDSSDYDQEQWTLRKAIWHKIDYTRYPGLLRIAWSMFKNSLRTYAQNMHGEPVFRIPVPHGMRGYLRVDLREHDEHGIFRSSAEPGTVELDKYGNLWVHEDDVENFAGVLGGADMDDMVAVIPIDDGRSLFYRNPNQYNEYFVEQLIFCGENISSTNHLVGDVPVKRIMPENIKPPNKPKTGNSLLDGFLDKLIPEENTFVSYTKANLLRTMIKIKSNTANIGLAANAEMARSAIGAVNKRLMLKLIKDFPWNLEKIIDATVKDGTDATEDMEYVNQMYEYIKNNKIEIPISLLNRIPERIRGEILPAKKKHPLDQLLDAIKYLIDKADVDILGKGSISRGNRIPGKIDSCDIPLIEIGSHFALNPFSDFAMNLLKSYNRSMAILLDSTKDKFDKDILRKEGILAIQDDLRIKIKDFTDDERALIVGALAYEIYKSPSAVHDSILWIGDSKGLKGTSCDMIRMLASAGEAFHIKKNGDLKRFRSAAQIQTDISSIRVWSKEEIKAESFSGAKEILVENGKILLGEKTLFLGDECKLSDGIYPVKTISQTISRKNTRHLLNNSLTIYLHR